ncbi:MAG: HAMP domain-containing sensor histidine kinase [Bacillota bacterium]|nr:HAMP domain-containing sensor histidine kinase [Bacillota bacterium]
MSLKQKIILLCVGIYFISLSLVAILVTEQMYSRMLTDKIDRCLAEESHMYSAVSLYLRGSQKEKGTTIDLEDYAARIDDMFKTDKIFLDIYSQDLKPLALSSPFNHAKAPDYLMSAQDKGRNYLLSWIDDRHYLLINDALELNGQKAAFSYINDITAIDSTRSANYLLFARIGLIGLLLVILLTAFISNLLLKPLNQLGSSTQRISRGHYDERAKIKTKDEIGELACQFNTMAAAVEEHVAALQREDERKQRFIDNFSHEMRTPLTAIIGYADMLKKIKYDEKVFFKGLNYIHNEGLRLQRLYSMLMNITLIRETRLEFETVQGGKIVRDALQMMAPLSGNSDIKLTSVCEDITLTVNQDLIKDVLGNLIENAIHASSPHSTITAGCKALANADCLFVKDEGCGISADDLQKIMEPFYRVDKSRSRCQGGLGLGLSICRDIVEKHGASLQIDSEPGNGTEIKIIWCRETGRNSSFLVDR